MTVYSPSGWRVLGASVMGTAHLKTGLPCQDAYDYQVLTHGLLVAAADGAGSAERSEAGARLAVETALNALTRALAGDWPASLPEWEAHFSDAYEQARQALAALAEEAGRPARDFATTLVVAAVSDDLLAVAQVGDGVIVAAAPETDWFVAAVPQRGEYANETHFLIQPDALQRLEVRVYAEPVQALAVMTDGLLRLVLDVNRNRPHGPFFQPLLAFAHEVGDEAQGQAQLEAFLASDRVCARTDDDKTLVLAVRWPPAPAGQSA